MSAQNYHFFFSATTAFHTVYAKFLCGEKVPKLKKTVARRAEKPVVMRKNEGWRVAGRRLWEMESDEKYENYERKLSTERNEGV